MNAGPGTYKRPSSHPTVLKAAKLHNDVDTQAMRQRAAVYIRGTGRWIVREGGTWLMMGGW